LRVARVQPAADSAAAEWVSGGVRGFAESVLSLVPAGFPAYLRIFHPAYRHEANVALPVRWAHIATANGTRAHAAMQLIPLTGGSKFLYGSQPGVYDQAPRTGSLPSELIEPLADVLARHTSTPGRCWFAIWNGFGDMPSDVRSAPTFLLPKREYHLLVGPIAAAAEGILPWQQSPNLWWPDDQAWCVAAEIDLNTTYIGCDENCRDEILAVAEIEAVRIDPATGITWRSDPLNPWPED
jgi:hypothetical protein